MWEGHRAARRTSRRLPVLAVVCAALLCCAAASAAPALAAPGDFAWLWTDVGLTSGYGQADACVVNGADDVVSVGSLPTGATTYEPFIRELASSRTPWYGGPLTANGELVAVTPASSGGTVAVGSIVTPGHGRDFLIARRSSDGTTTTKIWDGAAHREDRAKAVARRADGSILVTGMSEAADGSYDIVLVKYGPAGGRRWVKRFSSDRNDVPCAVKARGSALYVAGRADRGDHREDVVLLKYDATTGKRLWARHYDDSLHLDDFATSMVVTGSGIYLAGGGRTSEAGGDALLLRYLGDGTLKWARYTAGTPGMFDAWAAVAAASDDSIVTTGYVWRKATGDDLVTARYSSAGARRWERLFSSAGQRLDAGQAVVVDKTTGDIYIAGTISSAATGEDMGAVVYGPSGTRRWFARVDGGVAGRDWANACAVSRDSVYLVGGAAKAPADYDFAVARLVK